MSRIGKLPITIPEKVEVAIHPASVEVKGPKGTLTTHYEPTFVSVEKQENMLTVNPKNESQSARARRGLYRSLIQNLIVGVTQGFSKKLEIKGVGYRAALKGQVLELNLGFSHPVVFTIPAGIEVKFDEKSQTNFTISGIDKQVVGQVAAEIRSFKKPEPYKGKGIRYSDEYVLRKAGKSVSKK